MKVVSPIRDRILKLLRENPDGLATLVLLQRLGAERPVEQQSTIAALRGLVDRGLVRSTAGATPSSLWTFAPEPLETVEAPANYRGAGELTRARMLSAAKMVRRS